MDTNTTYYRGRQYFLEVPFELLVCIWNPGLMETEERLFVTSIRRGAKLIRALTAEADLVPDGR